MKKWIIILLIVLFVFFIAVKFASFSETSGIVLDTNGNPIEGVKVRMTYKCSEICLICQGPENYIFGYRDAITDSTGKFAFNSLFKTKINLPFPLTSCKKTMAIDKDGWKPSEFGSLNLKPSEKAATITLMPDSQAELQMKNAIDKLESVIDKWLCSRANYNCHHTYWDKKTEEAFAKEDPSFCNDVESPNFPGDAEHGRNACFNLLAVKTKDLSLCYQIRNEPKDGNTQRSCIYDTTLELGSNGDPSLCNDVGDSRNTCFNTMAVKKKDLSLCDQIKDSPTNSVEGTRRACRFNVTLELGNPALCSQLPNSPWQYKNWCEVYFN